MEDAKRQTLARIVRAGAEEMLPRQLALLEQGMQEFAGGAFPVEHHDRVVQEIFQVQFFIHQFFVVG